MLPYLISIRGFGLPTYGLVVALGFLVALFIIGRLAERSKLNRELVLNLAIYCALAGIVGAKLLMILTDLREYLADPRQLFSFSTIQAGGIFYGGLIGALIMATIYMRRKALPLLRTADVFAPGLAAGHAIGRLGCFAAGCCWGSPTRAPWAVTFTSPDAARVTGVPLDVPLHPAQLYESLGEAVIFVILYNRILKPHNDGAIIGLYLMLYAGLRFFVEFVRAHDPQSNPLTGPFSTEQWISIGIIGVGITYMMLSHSAHPLKRTAGQ